MFSSFDILYGYRLSFSPLKLIILFIFFFLSHTPLQTWMLITKMAKLSKPSICTSNASEAKARVLAHSASDSFSTLGSAWWHWQRISLNWSSERHRNCFYLQGATNQKKACLNGGEMTLNCLVSGRGWTEGQHRGKIRIILNCDSCKATLIDSKNSNMVLEISTIGPL